MSGDLLSAGPDELRTLDLQLWGRLCAARPVPRGRLPIPGQLTLRETQLLYYLLAEVWPGRGNVVELGTLFGTSTQAIGLGMAANRARRGSLFSADAFGTYLPPDEMIGLVEPLLGRRGDWALINAEIRAGDFERAFVALHGAGRPYSQFLKVSRCLIPWRVGDSPEALVALLEAASPVGVVFVDSVKNWYGVRAAMLEIVPRLADEALVAWQDQRWFNSFAITFCNEQLAQWLEPLAIADTTHVYRCHRAPSREEIEPLLPATPVDAGATELRRLFEDVAWRSYVANDAYGVLSATLQLAFVLAEIGDTSGAEELFRAAQRIPGFGQHDDLLQAAQGELADIVARAPALAEPACRQM